MELLLILCLKFIFDNSLGFTDFNKKEGRSGSKRQLFLNFGYEACGQSPGELKPEKACREIPGLRQLLQLGQNMQMAINRLLLENTESITLVPGRTVIECNEKSNELAGLARPYICIEEHLSLRTLPT